MIAAMMPMHEIVAPAVKRVRRAAARSQDEVYDQHQKGGDLEDGLGQDELEEGGEVYRDHCQTPPFRRPSKSGEFSAGMMRLSRICG